ncbi:hypothetical protein PYS58_15925 [Chryseobacterium indologenes]|uniref:hypothetical protein n=1 Tax=Chryseobacterium indologenes TaxID=253 RepID=UPI0023E882CE|nr:hypothetical protein [Chryseobacterium indologenes]WET48055.1 hypothetical protein PYS58_15925 [Chryseobacterium indologenes]
MKKLIIHSISVVISCIWLIMKCHTLNPVTLKGPEFLKFYLILIVGFYISIFLLKLFRETVSNNTFYILILIGGLGIIKLIRGVILGKPIGVLAMILVLELIVMFFLAKSKFKNELIK